MDLVGSVETIVKLGLTIKEAVDTVRRNEEECSEIRERVLRVGDILSPLQETGSMDDSPAISGALEDLEKTLWRAHTLVEACQEKSTICLFCTAGKQSTQLRKVQDDITQKVMVVIFATNVQLTMILTRLDRPCPQTLVSLPGDSSVGHTLAFSRPARRAHPAPAPPQSSPATTPAFAVPRRRRPPPFASTAAQDGRSRPPPSKSTASCVQTINDYAGRVHASADQSCWRKFSSLELETATNHFSEDNLIGRGAFAAVFKGVLRDGLGVAIKKFKHPYQLPAAHINDVLSLVSKLQHKNIVKFIGYGYEVIEKVDGFDDNKHQAQESHYFLVEEYMPNGSLDDIIYGSRIEWSSLFGIVQGIAQGLHYLHEQQLVHSDLKPNNILLDSDTNPKITDFGIARILDHGDDMPRDINYLAGTVGYMPPEYIVQGILSTKYDVYSFGVMLLEIISSMCRSKPAPRQASIEWAWMARQAGQMEELLDPSLYAEFQLKEIRRCMEVGLLCTQFKPADRPAMSDVLAMLDGKKKLRTPKQPGYTKGRKA